jgi:hypothetical protein
MKQVVVLDGATYRAIDNYRLKSKAIRIAQDFEKQGYKVKVVRENPWKGLWVVFIR